jgi:hypothetical protein
VALTAGSSYRVSIIGAQTGSGGISLSGIGSAEFTPRAPPSGGGFGSAGPRLWQSG